VDKESYGVVIYTGPVIVGTFSSLEEYENLTLKEIKSAFGGGVPVPCSCSPFKGGPKIYQTIPNSNGNY
jgi:hypothetical protein